MNNPIQALIVEDEVTNQKVLQSLLKKYCPEVNVKGVSSTCSQAIDDIKHHQPNLVFLDIKLDNNFTAFDLLDQLEDLNFYIVFITAYDEYALKAINEADAVFYITKPVKISDLEKAVGKVRQKLNEGEVISQDIQQLQTIKTTVNPANKIMFPTKDSFDFLDVQSIIRIQALGNYVQVFSTENKRYTVYKKLSFYEERLKNCNFMRVHRSHLINLALVDKFQKIGRGGVVRMTDDSRVQISPGYRQTFISKF